MLSFWRAVRDCSVRRVATATLTLQRRGFMSGSILLIIFFVTSLGCKLCAGFRRIENSPDLHQQPNLAVTIVPLVWGLQGVCACRHWLHLLLSEGESGKHFCIAASWKWRVDVDTPPGWHGIDSAGYR